eukprot:CAMPEP_0185263294 /NCGR_PEP_ID=MMETSP1359-20130426/13673_1 /TAXON_ID=552665 /ORGANISM="Bigelowiella longifila, Strain CCMP242" /LENGTH=76 /DNA_ID=CAMNT_0027850691 /DNA_START=32 /DNA_END=262 /DNA_ORIENTATION=+
MSASYTIQTFAPLGIIFLGITGMGYSIKGVQSLLGYHKERADTIKYRFHTNSRHIREIPPQYRDKYAKMAEDMKKE